MQMKEIKLSPTSTFSNNKSLPKFFLERILTLISVVIGIFLLLTSLSTSYAKDLLLFDAHIHYNQSDRAFLSPDQVLEFMDRAGIYGALVSSLPNEGTSMLYEKAPERIVPFLRPYRTLEDKETWYDDPVIEDYVNKQIKSGLYRGIGEIDLPGKYLHYSVVQQIIKLSIQRKFFLQIDADEQVINKLFELYPSVQIIWAHGGGTTPSRINSLLNRFPNLFVEVAGRTDIAKDGVIDEYWREVLTDHPDRFMIGSGSRTKRTLQQLLRSISQPNNLLNLFTNIRSTWVTSRWESLTIEARDIQNWLNQLPQNTSEQIAYKNAETIFNYKSKSQ